MLDPLRKHTENFDRHTELRSHANLQSRLVMRNGVPIENAHVEKRGVSARCYRGGAFGFASRGSDSNGAIDMLKTITHVSDDLTWSRGRMCGKKQLITVGMGGPAVKRRINLGGR